MNIENYTDGKERSDIDRIKEMEKVFGINVMSPFGTNNREVFEETLEDMSLKEMGRLAEKVGVIKAADLEVQRNVLREAFTDWVRKNGDPIGDKVKGNVNITAPYKAYDNITGMLDRNPKLKTFKEIFPQVENEKAFYDIICGYTLTDLRNLAGRLGFNPSFDRSRLILLLKNEFVKYLKMKSAEEQV